MIRQRVPLHQLHAVPLTQLPDDTPNPTSHLAEDRSFSILRHPHHVISAIPSDVGLALSLSHDGLLSDWGVHVWRPSHIHRPTPTTVEPLRVSPPEAVAYLI